MKSRARPRPAARPPAEAEQGPATRARLEVDERRAQLLTLGLSIFSERAYDEVSIDDIARAAGISKGLLYYYFPTKRDFYVAALRAASKELLDETLDKEKDASPEERVEQGVRTYLAYVERRGAAYVALMRGGIGSDPEVAAVLEETRTIFLDRIVAALPPEATGPLVHTAMRGWIGFVEVASIDWVARRSVPIGQIVTLAKVLLFDALRAATEVCLTSEPAPPKKKRAPKAR
ncbi:TetR/AcrR family transcriptional regulator [Polyangium sp. y55x31]|uniref:TetR/AcrR family transcriptional regulator n=1 Tax=Polyangium sp. y55x31 TaxID=3042688 RepID=UPI002482F486|nr:TetR/AcrR family transcriptional regulator [Polyangium sp. y55x31]MDI1480781.1 TetR/AcrR family transcriptional regulator [Polyangium sp. y55x31]